MTRKPLCPICRKPAAQGHEPFCSPRCREIDLARWFGETYRLPTADRPGEDTGSE